MEPVGTAGNQTARDLGLLPTADAKSETPDWTSLKRVVPKGHLELEIDRILRMSEQELMQRIFMEIMRPPDLTGIFMPQFSTGKKENYDPSRDQSPPRPQSNAGQPR